MDIITLQTATTAANGTYQINADLSALPAKYYEDDGSLDVEVDVFNGPDESLWTFPAAASEMDQAFSESDAAVAGADAETLNFDLTHATLTYARGTESPTSEPAPVGAGTASATAGTASVPDSTLCTTSKGARVTDKNERFTNVYTWSGAPATVKETKASSHTLGIGADIDGEGWAAHGSTSMTANISASAGQTYKSNFTLYNAVNYRHSTVICSNNTGWTHTTKYLKPTGFYDLLTSKQSINSANFNWCSPHAAGGYFTKTKGTNKKFKFGVTLPIIKLSSQAAFSQSTSIHWTFNQATELCGSTSQGPASSPQTSATAGGGCPNAPSAAPRENPSAAPARTSDPNSIPC